MTALVLAGTRRKNDGCIENTVFTQHQAVFLQVFVHFFKQHLAESVALQKMAELENDGFVLQAIQHQAGKVLHGFNFVAGVFHDRGAEVLEQLHAVDSQHG